MIMKPKAIILLFDGYTVFLWAWLVLEFFSKDAFHMPTSLTTVYLVILGIYVGDKEFERLRKRYASRQLHGERFVLLWVVTLIAVSTTMAFYRNGYRIPGDLPVITASVLILWLVSEFVKKRKK